MIKKSFIVTFLSQLTFFFLSFLLIMESEKAKAEGPQVVQIQEMSKEIQLPTKLWDVLMDASFQKAVKDVSHFTFSEMKVRLEDKTSGVLSSPSILIDFPKAGGEIDFSKYVVAERGSFKIYFDWDGFSSGSNFKIYYLSQARKRKIDNQIYGSGCREFFNVTDYISNANKKEGLVVNVTKDRHDSALGGYFVFSYKKLQQTFITLVSFYDLKRPDLFCSSISAH